MSLDFQINEEIRHLLIHSSEGIISKASLGHIVSNYCPLQVRKRHCTQLQNVTRHFLQTFIESSITAPVSPCRRQQLQCSYIKMTE